MREASDATGHSVGILADLQGPKIRLGRFEGGSAFLKEGSLFTVTSENTDAADRAPRGTSAGATTSYGALATDVGPGDTLLIDDGMVKLGALSSDGHEVRFRVIEGGMVSDHKGMNLPGVAVSATSLSDKDVDDLRFALALGVDLVALSFVRGPEDADAVRRVMDSSGRRVPLIAKLEKPEAVDRLEEVIDAFDGLMVARGDLGVEVPLEQVPLIQKRAVQLARERAKPVIVATQLLESMIHHSRPTRAEASDVANAVLDGADALMLSGETAVGRLPGTDSGHHGPHHFRGRAAGAVDDAEGIGTTEYRPGDHRHGRPWRRANGRTPEPLSPSRQPAPPPGASRASAPTSRCWHSRPKWRCAASWR